MERVIVRVITQAAAATAVVSAAATVVLAMTIQRDPQGVVLAVLAPALLALVIVGRAGASSDPRNPVGWIFLAAGVALPVSFWAYLYSTAAFDDGRDLAGAHLAGWLDGWPWIPALTLLPTVGVLLFPDGRLPSRRWRPVLWIAILVNVALVFSTLFAPSMLDFWSVPNPTGTTGPVGDFAKSLLNLIALVPILCTLSVVAITLRRRRAVVDSPEEQMLRLVTPAAWVLAASWWVCFAITMIGGPSVDVLPLEATGALAMAVVAWIAIRRYGLFDARLVLNRALVYGALFACVIAIYLLLVAALNQVASEVVSGPVAVAAAALVALPLRDVLQRRANLLVYGYRDDPYAALVRLGQRLADAGQPEDVLPAVAHTVRQALRVPSVSILLGGETAAVAGVVAGGQHERFDLVFANEPIGLLLVEVRDDPFTPAERELLDGVVLQTAVAAHAVALTADLIRSRERIVLSAEEERRRLRRDLHDGLGPALAGVVLGLQTARRRLDTDAESVGERLDLLTVHTQDAVAEVRRLVEGLRPPALDELGLIAALGEQARMLGPIAVQGPSEPFELSAALEVAVYRIAMEAMTNAVRHARATACDVHVSIDGSVHLQVADDGIGLPDDYRAGVGITSMRERATELGGTCTIGPRTPSGTLIHVAIPLGTP